MSRRSSVLSRRLHGGDAHSLCGAAIPRLVRVGLPAARTGRPRELRVTHRTARACLERVPDIAAPVGRALPPIERTRDVGASRACHVRARHWLTVGRHGLTIPLGARRQDVVPDPVLGHHERHDGELQPGERRRRRSDDDVRALPPPSEAWAVSWITFLAPLYLDCVSDVDSERQPAIDVSFALH